MDPVGFGAGDPGIEKMTEWDFMPGSDRNVRADHTVNTPIVGTAKKDIKFSGEIFNAPDGDVWIKHPQGWVAAKYKGTMYGILNEVKEEGFPPFTITVDQEKLYIDGIFMRRILGKVSVRITGATEVDWS